MAVESHCLPSSLTSPCLPGSGSFLDLKSQDVNRANDFPFVWPKALLMGIGTSLVSFLTKKFCCGAYLFANTWNLIFRRWKNCMGRCCEHLESLSFCGQNVSGLTEEKENFLLHFPLYLYSIQQESVWTLELVGKRKRANFV